LLAVQKEQTLFANTQSGITFTQTYICFWVINYLVAQIQLISRSPDSPGQPPIKRNKTRRKATELNNKTGLTLTQLHNFSYQTRFSAINFVIKHYILWFSYRISEPLRKKKRLQRGEKNRVFTKWMINRSFLHVSTSKNVVS
jgi:hypothetical protein